MVKNKYSLFSLIFIRVKKYLLIGLLFYLLELKSQQHDLFIEADGFRDRFIQLLDTLRDRMYRNALTGKIKVYKDAAYSSAIKPKDIDHILDLEILKYGKGIYKSDDYGKLLPYSFTYQGYRHAFGIGIQVGTQSDFKTGKLSNKIKGLSFAMAHSSERVLPLKTAFFIYYRLQDIKELVSTEEWSILMMLFDTNIHNMRELESKEDYKSGARIRELCIPQWEMHLEPYTCIYIGGAFIEKLRQTIYDRSMDFSLQPVYKHMDSLRKWEYVGEELPAAFRKETYVLLYDEFGMDRGIDSLVYIQQTLSGTNVRYLPEKKMLLFEGFVNERKLYVDMDKVMEFLSPKEKIIWKWYLGL